MHFSPTRLALGFLRLRKRSVQVPRASGSPATGGPVPPALVSSSPSLWTLVPQAPGFRKKCFSDLGSNIGSDIQYRYFQNSL